MAWGQTCQPCPMPGTTDFELLCPHGPGSTFDGNDINECAQNPNICQNGACENLIGTYRCICNPGYEVDETGKICTDINECEVDDVVRTLINNLVEFLLKKHDKFEVIRDISIMKA